MPVSPPNTAPKLSHALTIRVNGVTIGAISDWSPRQQRTITELYEFGNVSGGGEFGIGNGEPFAKVPGNVSGMQMEIRRYDLYTLGMEEAFDTPDLTMLSSQNDPIEVREAWLSPDNQRNYAKLYRGCWFSSIGRTMSTSGDRTVQASATLEYTRAVTIPI